MSYFKREEMPDEEYCFKCDEHYTPNYTRCKCEENKNLLKEDDNG